MNVFRPSFEYESHRCQSSQAICDRRPTASDPDRIRHGDRVSFEVSGLPFKEVLEIRTADFLFEFPDELNVDGSTIFDGISRAEQSREGGTFVVGCPPPD